MREWCRRDDFYNTCRCCCAARTPPSRTTSGESRRKSEACAHPSRPDHESEPIAMSDPIVIVSRLPARPSPACWATSPTSLPGSWAPSRSRRRWRRRRARRRRRRSAVRQLPDGGAGQAPARQAMPRPACRFHRRRHDEQDVRPGHARDDVRARHAGRGSANVMLAGGMESMTNAPHLDVRAQGRQVRRERRDVRPWRSTAWKTPTSAARRWACSPNSARKYGFTREAMDQFAIQSTQRSKKANEDGSFEWEIAPVTLPGKAGDGDQVRRAAPRPSSTRSPASSPRSRKTARSPPPPRRASPTAPRRWC